MKKKQIIGFKAQIKMLASHNTMMHEGAFHDLLFHVEELIDKLTAEFEHAENDELRNLLLELIGDSHSLQAFKALAQQLRSDKSFLRYWAIDGLQRFGTSETRHQLMMARHYELSTPEATQQLRDELDRVLGPEQAWEKSLVEFYSNRSLG